MREVMHVLGQSTHLVTECRSKLPLNPLSRGRKRSPQRLQLQGQQRQPLTDVVVQVPSYAVALVVSSTNETRRQLPTLGLRSYQLLVNRLAFSHVFQDRDDEWLASTRSQTRHVEMSPNLGAVLPDVSLLNLVAGDQPGLELPK